jgi:hypothetical protein
LQNVGQKRLGIKKESLYRKLMEKIENFSFDYSLSKDDHLNYSLYNTNQLKSIQKID